VGGWRNSKRHPSSQIGQEKLRKEESGKEKDDENLVQGHFHLGELIAEGKSSSVTTGEEGPRLTSEKIEALGQGGREGRGAGDGDHWIGGKRAVSKT